METIEHEKNDEISELPDVCSTRVRILENLKECGFSIIDGKTLIVPQDKELIRKVHSRAVKFLMEKQRQFIEDYDGTLLEKYIINGKDLYVNNINPVLRKVDSKLDNILFRWVKLHWSIPISAGYGRRLRYIVYDEGNSAVMGIIGLSDPVYALGDRDRYIGWSPDARKRNLKHVMDAFVLGSVPPYSMVLGGKIVASMLLAPQIVKDFSEKYRGKKTLISGEVFDGNLAAITTASALGKSSVYDRIKIPGTSGFLHVGWSKGSGEFQFLNDVYTDLFNLAHERAQELKNRKWGNGVRNRRTVIRTGLTLLGLPPDLMYHNIKRELFLVPLGNKSLEYLRGESKSVEYYDRDINEILKFALDRWVKKRAETRKEYLDFKRGDYSLITDLLKTTYSTSEENLSISEYPIA